MKTDDLCQTILDRKAEIKVLQDQLKTAEQMLAARLEEADGELEGDTYHVTWKLTTTRKLLLPDALRRVADDPEAMDALCEASTVSLPSFEKLCKTSRQDTQWKRGFAKLQEAEGWLLKIAPAIQTSTSSRPNIKAKK